ncbi:MAG: biopolymer transporter ExbD [Kangiellaceae bacterium]|jgi:biopolymer transport protein ExbD|nr:biopolymer transporter ExbD [Kangiellaceae bacterium]
MARLADRNDFDDDKVDMTPMLDIVFIMLIFFIVTSSFIKESGLDIAPSSSSSDQSDELPLLIEINAGGDIDINGRLLDVSQVAPTVEAWRINQQNPQVIIAINEQTATEQLIAVTDQVRLGKVNKVSVSRLSTN